MKALLMLLGIAAMAAGRLFAGQGLGLVPWPAESFMVGAVEWAYYGAGIAAAGLLLVVLSRR